MPALARALALACALLTAAARVAPAQSSALPDAASLRTPASPAFILLGVSPTDVYKPRSVADFAATAVSGGRDFTAIPRNLAVETGPYWLRSRPRLTWRDDARRTVAQSLARTLALSFATTPQGTDDAPSTGVAAGLRVSLLSGRLSDSARRWLERIEESARRQGAIFLAEKQRLQEAQRAELAAQLRMADSLYANDVPRRDAERAAAVARFAALDALANERIEADPAYVRRIRAEREKIEDLALGRTGLVWDVAGGAAWAFAGDRWESGELGKHGVWTTLTHDGAEFGRWSPIVTVRWLRDAAADDDPGMLDLGGRLLRSTDRFGLSVEYVHRRLTSDVADSVARTQYRLTGMFEYRLAADTWLVASFGRAYDDEPRRGNLVAQLGVTAAFSRERYRKP